MCVYKNAYISFVTHVDTKQVKLSNLIHQKTWKLVKMGFIVVCTMPPWEIRKTNKQRIFWLAVEWTNLTFSLVKSLETLPFALSFPLPLDFTLVPNIGINRDAEFTVFLPFCSLHTLGVQIKANLPLIKDSYSRKFLFICTWLYVAFFIRDFYEHLILCEIWFA